MPPFEQALQAVARRLDIPQPERARILEEIAGDLEDLKSVLMRDGLSPDDAEREALKLLAPSEAAMSALVSVHETLYRTLVRRFASRIRLAEWIGLVSVTVAPILMVTSSMWRGGWLRDPSPFLVPVLVTAVGIVAVAGRKAIQLYAERDHDPRRLRTGLPALLIGSAFAIACSLAGALFELYRLAARVEVDPAALGELVVPWFLDTVVLVGAGLTTALIGGLCWFVFLRKVSAVERADMRMMSIADPAAPTAPLSLHDSLTPTGAR